LTMSSYDVQLADAVANTGIVVSSGAISAVYDNATIGINGSQQLYVKANGINDTHIDWGLSTNQVSAGDIPLADAGGYFGTDDVEWALQYLASQLTSSGVSYTVGVGGVTKGDVVYVSSDNTVLPYATLTSNQFPLGIALTTELAAASVKVLANDTVVTGVLSSATAGDVYYWNGTALVSTPPATTGVWVIQAGVAKNTTDLHVEVMKVKKNA